MRRKDKEITDINEIRAVIRKAEVCRLGLAVDNTPYVVPVFFGYEDQCLYIHCAREGRKLEMIRQNPQVCFEMDIDTEITGRDRSACQWSAAYRSVIGWGKAAVLDDFAEKKHALEVIMRHYSDQPDFIFRKEEIEKVEIVKIVVTAVTGKQSLK